jgi:putative nucleotidyltransferase with HDIG domain
MSILNKTSMLRRLGTAKDVSMNDSQQAKTPLAGRPWAKVTPSGLYFAALVCVAGVIFVWQAPQLQGNIPLLAVLVIMNVAAGLMPINIYGDSRISVGFVVTLAIIVVFGVPGAVIVGVAASLGPILITRHFNSRAIPNAALFVVTDAAAGAAYLLISDLDPDSVSVELAVGIMAATVTSFALTAVLFSIPFLIARSHSIRELWERHAWLAPQQIAMGVVGFGLAAAQVSLGLAGIIAFAMPAFMMRVTMKQYVDKTQENVEKLQTQNQQLESANVEVMRMSDELRESYDGTLEALVNALDARDQETKGHSLRVSRYMMDIARELGVKEGTKEWIDMQRGSLLHDVGKIGVSDSILLKPGKLTDEEWSLMREHPVIGYNMLKQVHFLEGAAQIILNHHERWDGKGYPSGLSHEDIPLGARIFGVVDTFDSMTSDRPYRRALKTQDALNEILKFSGSQFDPLVVEAFLDIYETWVKQRDQMMAESLRAA